MLENTSDQITIGFGFKSGWKSGANFLDQSQGVVNQNKNNQRLLSTLS